MPRSLRAVPKRIARMPSFDDVIKARRFAIHICPASVFEIQCAIHEAEVAVAGVGVAHNDARRQLL